MHINDFKKQNEMNQSGTKSPDFKSQSGIKIVGLSIYYCTKCGLPSPIKLPTKCPQGGFHVWAKA